MIHAEINDDGYIPQLEATGDSLHIAAEFAALACNMYAILSKSDADIAEVFKAALQVLLKDGGAAWDTRNSRNTGRGGCVIAKASIDTTTNEENER